MRQCKCGAVKGRYLNMAEAELSENAISIAIGNGSLERAIVEMEGYFNKTLGQAGRSDYYKEGNGKIEYAWVRPNSGPGNPHTKLL